MLDRLDALSNQELEDFIGQSYEMVVAKVPIKKKKTTSKKSLKKRKKSQPGRRCS
jgi:hypothetical protein